MRCFARWPACWPRSCRRSDLPARYGGEEFAVVTPQTTAQTATQFAERLRTSICSQPLQAEGKSIAISASFGVAGHEGIKSPDQLLQAADQALYRAKSAGRNCVEGVAGSEPHDYIISCRKSTSRAISLRRSLRCTTKSMNPFS